MKKLAILASTLLAAVPCHVRAAPLGGKPVPLFPDLTWGLDQQAALAKGLRAYKSQDTKTDVIGLPSVTLGAIGFSAQAAFGKNDISEVRTGLNYIVLRHEGFVPKGQYNEFIRTITKGFLYAGKASAIDESASFYNSINNDNYLVVTTSDRANASLSVAIAPGVSK